MGPMVWGFSSKVENGVMLKRIVGIHRIIDFSSRKECNMCLFTLSNRFFGSCSHMTSLCFETTSHEVRNYLY